MRLDQMVIGILLALAAFRTSVLAQTTSGTVKGVVVDTSGAVVPGATCTLTDVATQVSDTVSSFSDGAFTFTGVAPGSYTLKIDATGFKSLTLESVVLTAGELRTLGNLKLEVGEARDIVEVTAEAAAIELGSAEHSGLVSGSQIDDIAIKGRDLFGFLSTMAGVVNTNGGGLDSAGIGSIGTVSINGNRLASINVAYDGITILNTGNNNNLHYEPNLDAIEEIKVLSSNYQAEFGRMGGGQVLIVTKSGTKQFHGSGYDYYRDEELNANDFFSNKTGTPRAIYRYRVTGYAIGGPVYIPRKFNTSKDKLFFFFSQDFSRTRENPGVDFVTMPTALERQGNFSQSYNTNGSLIVIKDPTTGAPFPGNIIPPSDFNSHGQALLNAFPLPNYVDPNPANVYQWNYRTNASNPYPKTQEIFHADYNISSSMRLSFRLANQKDCESADYGLSQGKSGSVDFDLGLISYCVPGKGNVGHFTKIFSPTLISETVFGDDQTRSQAYPVDLNTVSNARFGNMPRIFPNTPAGSEYIPGIMGQFTFGSIPANTANPNLVGIPWDNLNRNYDFTENLSKVIGKHQIKMGVYINRTGKSDPTGGIPWGSWDFSNNATNPLNSGDGWSNALLGNFNSYSESTGRPEVFTRRYNFEPYIQDNWRVTTRLTLDYGLRFYDWRNTVEATNSFSAFVPALYNPANAVTLYQPALVNGVRVAENPLTGATSPAAYIGAIIPGTGNLLNGMELANQPGVPRGLEEYPAVSLGPRFGFAYDVFGTGNTAIRGGVGIFFDELTTGAEEGLKSSPPNYYTYEIFDANVSQVQANGAGIANLSPGGLFGRIHLPSIMNYSLGIQQRVLHTVVDISYVGAQSRHLYATKNWNPIPMFSQFTDLDPTTGNKSPLPNTLLVPYVGYGNINLNQPQASANFNSLQATISRRLATSLQIGISYSFSKSLGVDSFNPYFAPRHYDYGPEGVDRSQSLVFNYIYAIPNVGTRLGFRPAGWVLDHWSVSGITTFQTGAPVSPTFTTTTGENITGSAIGPKIDVVGSPSLSHPTFNEVFNTAAFALTPACSATFQSIACFGNAGNGILRQPGINNWDLSLTKRIPLGSEARLLQLRGEAFNAWNHAQFATLNTSAIYNPATGQQINPLFGSYASSRTPRIVQLSVRVSF
jgi:Carboxypeptidase regulatory-like domain